MRVTSNPPACYNVNVGTVIRTKPNGNGEGDMLKATYDPQGRETDIFQYVDEHIQQEGLTIEDLESILK